MDKHRQLEEYKRMLKDAIDTDGVDFCIDCLIEECAELIVAIRHYRRGRTNVNKVIEEMADVNLMCDMVRIGLDNEVGFYDVIKQKSVRVGERIAFKKSKR